MSDRTFLFGTTVVWSAEHHEAFVLATGQRPPVTAQECLRLLQAVPKPAQVLASGQVLGEADAAAGVRSRLAEQLQAELQALRPRMRD